MLTLSYASIVLCSWCEGYQEEKHQQPFSTVSHVIEFFLYMLLKVEILLFNTELIVNQTELYRTENILIRHVGHNIILKLYSC